MSTRSNLSQVVAVQDGAYQPGWAEELRGYNADPLVY